MPRAGMRRGRVPSLDITALLERDQLRAGFVKGRPSPLWAARVPTTLQPAQDHHSSSLQPITTQSCNVTFAAGESLKQCPCPSPTLQGGGTWDTAALQTGAETSGICMNLLAGCG